MTPRQFAVLQQLNDAGWTLRDNIASHCFGGDTAACNRVLALLRGGGLVERVTKHVVKPLGPTGYSLNLVGYELTAAGEAALVTENLRLLKEIT